MSMNLKADDQKGPHQMGFSGCDTPIEGRQDRDT